METIAALLVAGASWMGLAAPQTRPAQTPPAPAAAQPAGPAWQMVCPPAAAPGAAPAAQPCSLVQNLLAGEQKQRLLTLILQRSQAGHNMTIALPHGVLFPGGVSVQVDEAAPVSLAVQTSDQNGAYTGTAVDAAMLAAMRSGKTVKIGFTAGNGQRIVVPVTLRDFPAGLTALDKTPLPQSAGPKPTPAPANPAAPAPR